MSFIPKNQDEAITTGKKILWAIARFQIIGLIIGGGVTIAVQLLTGFWDFREQHQQTIAYQYRETLDADKHFENLIERYNLVLKGMPNIEAELGDYSSAAHAYIQSISASSNLLPQTNDELSPLVDAIVGLNKYYSVDDPPPVGSAEWLLFFGQFRQDYGRFIDTKAAYLQALSDEAGNYTRHILNPSGS